MMLINKYIYNIFGAITISIILRILLLNEYGDTELVNEWGTLFNNLKYNNILALRSFERCINSYSLYASTLRLLHLSSRYINFGK